MTRRKEIKQKALSKYPQGTNRYNKFIEGARWADKTMIEKACQWIETYLFDIGFPDDWCRDSATMKSGKQRFIEAMEE